MARFEPRTKRSAGFEYGTYHHKPMISVKVCYVVLRISQLIAFQYDLSVADCQPYGIVQCCLDDVLTATLLV